MATQSCCEKEQKQQQGEVPAGPKNQVPAVPGGTHEAKSHDAGAGVPTVPSDPSRSGDGASRGGIAGASSCAMAAAGAISSTAEDPGPLSIDCEQESGRPEQQGGPSPHAVLRPVGPETGRGLQTVYADSAATMGQATNGAVPASGRLTQTRGSAKGRGRKRPSRAEAAQAQKLPWRCMFPGAPAPLPPSSSRAQRSSHSRRAPQTSPLSGRIQPGPVLRSQALLSTSGPALRSHSARPGPALRSRATQSNPASRRRAPEPGPASRRRAPEPGPASRRRAPEAGPASRRRAPEPGPASRRRAPEPGPASRRRAPEPGPASRRRAPEPGPASRRRAPEPGPASRRRAPEPGPASRRRAPEPGPASRRRAPEPGPASRRRASTRGTASHSIESRPGRALRNSASAPGPLSPTRAAGPDPAFTNRPSSPGPVLRRRASGPSPALRSRSPTSCFVLRSRHTQRRTSSSSRPSVSGDQSPNPSPEFSLRRLVSQSSSRSPEPEVPNLPSQPRWHAVRMRASSPSPPGQSSSSSSPTFGGLGSISTPSPASLRRALLLEFDAPSPVSPEEQAETESIPRPTTPPVL
ncbi:EZH inhibitory protein [Rousettus aegyptiacus]|uniref:EZH inhibitory protein n=1 Tax=Rousettus aegyptiacus TaxID=9407 RepID=UPI00168D3940|nr:EZH inhibitory protein [Rousettus aegyptiacus]